MKHYNALKALNKPFSEAFPIYAITSKLDDQTRLRWKEKTQGTDLPTMEELLEFLHNRRRVLETTRVEPAKQPQTRINNSTPTTRINNATPTIRTRLGPVTRNRGSPNNIVPAHAYPVQQARCYLCKANHFTQYCQKLTAANVDERTTMIRKAGLCINCLRPNHEIKDCIAGCCKQCNGKHHTLLHKEQKPVQANVSALSANCLSETILSTAIVYVRDNYNRPQPCRVLLDSGSQSHFITEKFANRLSLPLNKIDIPVVGINQTTSQIRNSLRTSIRSRVNNFTTDLTFLILPRITEILPSCPISKTELNIPANIPLADPEFNTPSEIDGLIGAEVFFKLLCIGQISIANNLITLQKTKLGWILAGKLPSKESVGTTHCHVACNALDTCITKFWELEEPPQESVLSIEERACESHFINTTTRESTSGRYVVKLPFKARPPTLGNSYSTALRRFHALERTLNKSPDLKHEYVKFLHEYHNLGHMEVLNNPNTQTGYYLPHHAVLKHDSLTTKLRVVFDASAKTSNGISLNDALLTGPTIQEELYTLLIRFRSYAYVLTADIEKMYRQVLVHPEDRIYQKILWRDNSDQPIKTYTLNTVTYGTSAAPFLSTRAMHQLAIDEGEHYPRAARVLREDFYVDDLLTGADSYLEAAAIVNEITALCSKGGFRLRQWATNNESLIDELQHDKTDATCLRLDLDKTIKTLGVHWNAKEDSLTYSLSTCATSDRVTKRTILSKIATLFDPLGLFGPIIIRAKLIMQSLWKIQVDWDESMPTDLHTEWCTYWEELRLLSEFKVKRHITQHNCTSIQLHGFCDASERAYGACLYIRSVNEHGEIASRLITSKSRVAPLKVVTLPRLELCAAHLLAKLYATTKHALRHLNFDKTVFWSDSTITLHWLNSEPHMLKTFVAHRVASVQGITGNHEWRHINSNDNPADLISRGMHTTDCIRSNLWHCGPSWLILSEEQWPFSIIQPTEIPELRPIVALSIQIDSSFLERFSSFHRLRRVTAYMIRFIQNSLKREQLKGPLSAAELHKAELRIIWLAQQSSYQTELHDLKSKNRTKQLSSLNPFLDSDGILRVGGRLAHADLPYNEKHPMLLNKNSHLAKLIVREAHLENFNAGAQATLNAVRRKFWIPHGKGLIRQTIHECVTCRRAKTKVVNYPMGDLPKNRITHSRPFCHTGVDFCGPLFIKEKIHRNRGKIKVYLSIFVCFSTRAVHIEIVSDLTTDAFLAALRRFFSRRGKPSDIYSDNATNFVGAKRELTEFHTYINDLNNSNEIVESLANEQINWHFIPPRSPHFGGIWEAAVKSAKHHMTRVIGNALLSFEGLLTFTTQIEAILNSRPLTPISSDPNDLTAITPSHFLIGESLMSVPDHDYANIPDGRLSSWQHIQQLRQHFWKRWRSEYLQELISRKKWHTGEIQHLAVGTMVVVQEDNTPPMQWTLGRITSVHPGADGIIRVVTVRTSRGEYKRTVKRIAPLPIEQ
ncbi:uncharacterized protein LOC143264752 [Megachile rotundata]|uniref:uncharacterized protein LOC143264752 n=1 Tax=Megachile rotundata TaxID=143995 RepID=UPI003FD13541